MSFYKQKKHKSDKKMSIRRAKSQQKKFNTRRIKQWAIQ